MTTLYVAGPMTGYPGLNFEAFDEATTLLRRWFSVINPAEEDRFLGIDPSDEAQANAGEAEFNAAMRRDIEYVLSVDGIALLEGWEKSRGANIEVTVAKAIGIPVQTVEEWASLAALMELYK